MSKPIVVEDISGYTLAWEQEQIKVTITNVRNHASDGSIKGMLRVETTKPGSKPLLHSPAQFNFMATRSRDELAKRLTQRMDDTDWYAILEQTANEVIARVARGEPVEDLCTEGDIEPPKMIMAPIAVEGLVTVLFGDRGAGKSTILLTWSQVMQLPWIDNPLGFTAPDTSYPCLYLDWENTSSVVRWQLKKLQNGMSPGKPFFQSYRRMSRPLCQDVEAVRNAVRDARASVLFIDSLGPASGGDLNATQPALDFFGALSQINAYNSSNRITVIALAHTAKNSDGKTRSVYGNGFYENEARNIWEIRALQEPGDDTLEVGLFHRKPLPFYGKQKPFGYKLTFTETSTNVEPQNPEVIREFHAAMGSQKQIEQYLLDAGQQTTESIADATSLTLAAVQQALKRLKSKNRVACLKTGNGWKWCVLVNQEVANG